MLGVLEIGEQHKEGSFVFLHVQLWVTFVFIVVF